MLATLLLFLFPLLAQQHSFTPAEIENGGRLFQGSCAGCHGTTGDSVPGINLLRGQFRRAASDTDLIGIIRTGIPGTSMPPANFSQDQAGMIVAYLRNAADSPVLSTTLLQGDAGRGKVIFETKGNCRSCHRVNGMGVRTAPDLSDVGRLRQAGELERALLDPTAEMRPGNRFFRATMKDGATVTGRLLNQDSFSIQLIDSREQLVSLVKANLREYGFLKDSPMPSFKDKLNAQELADLVSYLLSLKGQNP
jgi:putative heme-binding domain-containing protein